MNRQSQLKERITQLRLDENEERRRLQQDVLNHLRREQCYVISMESLEGSLNAVYTVGLWHSFKHPEIMILGIPEGVGQRLLSDMRDLIKIGQPPAVGCPVGRRVEYYPVRLEPVGDRDFIRQYLSMADWFYSDDPFPVLQLFWSVPESESPWPQFQQPKTSKWTDWDAVTEPWQWAC